MMKILDRYLIKQFLQSILFGLLAFTLLFVIVDMLENLDDFIDQNVSMSIVSEYYSVFAPEIIKLMLPVSVLFAGLFTAGKMSNLNEITAIKASGVSLYRFMLPIVIVTCLLSWGAIYFSGYVVPMANKHKIAIERNYLRKGFSQTGSNLFFQDSKNRIINISYYDESNMQAVRTGIQEFDQNDLTKMVSRIEVQNMKFDTTKNVWVGYNGIIRHFTLIDDIIEAFQQKDFPQINFKPQDLTSKQKKPDEMDLEELKNLIDDQIRSGTDPKRVMIEYYSRYSFALASLVVVLFGLPLSMDKRRGGLALQVGINILITFIYLVFLKVTQAYGKNGALEPVLTAWIVNLIFLAGAIVNLIRVKQ